MGLEGIRPRVSVELVDRNGVVVLDEVSGRLLLLIERCGSILCAAHSLGIAYSRAWDRIGRVERLLGTRIVEARRGGRGGGGARLTEAGRELLMLFLEAYRRVHGADPVVDVAPGGGMRAGFLLYAGSNDPLLQRVIGVLREEGILIEAHWIGSLNGLASVLLGEADVAGIHLVDRETGEYNVHVVGALARSTDIVLVRGYRRLQGFVTRRPMSLEEIVEGLLRGRLRLVNREEGTGSRVLLEHVLSEWAGRLGIREELSRVVKGWDNVAKTHVEVAERVARGEADVGLAVKAAASLYGLGFTPVTWESFDFVARRQSFSKKPLREFIEYLCSEEFRALLRSIPGYQEQRDTCRVVEAASSGA